MVNKTKVADTDINLVVKIAQFRKSLKMIWRRICTPFRKFYFFFETRLFLHRRPEAELRSRVAQGKFIINLIKTDPEMSIDPRKDARIEQYTADMQQVQRALNKKLKIKGNPGKDNETKIGLKPANLTAKIGKGE